MAMMPFIPITETTDGSELAGDIARIIFQCQRLIEMGVGTEPSEDERRAVDEEWREFLQAHQADDSLEAILPYFYPAGVIVGDLLDYWQINDDVTKLPNDEECI